MRKLMMIGFLLLGSILAQGEIKVKIHEPTRFKDINTKAYGELIVGQGAIEVYSTDIDEDRGKKVKIKLPEKGILTNKKRVIKIDKYKIARADEEFVIDREKRIVNFYAFIRRRDLNKNELDGSIVEGEYVGYTPILIEQYGKPINRPIFKDENRPVVLPEFPDGNRPVTLPERRK